MQEHYFTEKPKSKRREEKFKTKLLGNEIEITSASGIFSVKEVDFGTRLLIENAQVPFNANILDLGCGYGVVGVALKKARPDLKVTLADINERAVKYAGLNARNNGVECTVVKGNLFENLNYEFNTILTNPPFSAGKKLCIEFIRQSRNHLIKGGSFQLVAPHNKGGSSLKAIMLETFGNVDELVKKSGYRVYRSIK
jgi:16S rRNA G1207 methylase RsmC